MIAFIDDHRQAHGVEPICRVLNAIALSTYHAHVAKRVDPLTAALLVTDGTLPCKGGGPARV